MKSISIDSWRVENNKLVSLNSSQLDKVKLTDFGYKKFWYKFVDQTVGP